MDKQITAERNAQLFGSLNAWADQQLKRKSPRGQERDEEYKKHVDNVNLCMGRVNDPKLLDRITRLVVNGERLTVYRNYFADVNIYWNSWTGIYNLLKTVPADFDRNYRAIDGALDSCVSLLEKLRRQPDEQARQLLLATLSTVSSSADILIGSAGNVVTGLDRFRSTFDNQKKCYENIKRALSADIQTQQARIDALNREIKQLRSKIDSYNASIAALAIAAGVSVVITLVSIKVLGPFSIVVALFLAPAVAAAIYYIAQAVIEIGKARERIASLSGQIDYARDTVIAGLCSVNEGVGGLETSVYSVKDDVSEALRPWKAIKWDAEDFKRLLDIGGISYDKAYTDVVYAKCVWERMVGNASKLTLDTGARVVRLELSESGDLKSLLSNVRSGDGISVDEYLARCA